MLEASETSSPRSGRRGFLRNLSTMALAGLSAAAGILTSSPTATAAPGDGCCDLVFSSSSYCHTYCVDAQRKYYCWTCNGGQCYCCECTSGASCYYPTWYCSYNTGNC